MWNPDQVVHKEYVERIRALTKIEDSGQRYLTALGIIESEAATWTGTDEKFRAFAMVISQYAQDPSLQT